MKRKIPTALERSELRDYSLLWRLAFPHKSRASVKRYRKRNPMDHAADYQRRKQKQPGFYLAKRANDPEAFRRRERAYWARRKGYFNAKARARRRSDVNWRLRLVLRCLLNRAVKRNWKTGTAVELLGCSVASFKLYLESKFESGMTWENYGRGVGKWNIDHIMPCAIFDLSKPEHQRRCFHFSNQQPLWATVNSAKGAKILC